MMLHMLLWTPAFILFSYPLVYIAIPHLLLKGKVLLFFIIVVAWGAVGLVINLLYANYIFVPMQEWLHLKNVSVKGLLAARYLCMTTAAASPMAIKFFKLWMLKQRAWLQAEQDKISAELKLLKAQVHPHFLFNTLNNIYSFSLENSPKTPELILKLSSLLSYMLYECKAEEVRLEKELEIMRNYIDLEKERYGKRIDISWNVEGDIHDKFIAPLMLLPFLENAFKHGAAEQLEKSWLSVDIAAKHGILKCKIVNSKNECVAVHGHGIGIENVKKRLEFLYPGKHELRLNDEGDFFVVALTFYFETPATYVVKHKGITKLKKRHHEIALSAGR
jgi:sensor histidine kinase YesM